MSTTKSDFFEWRVISNDFFAAETACGWAAPLFVGILPCTKRGSSSIHSHFLKSPALLLLDTSILQGLPAPQTSRSAFRRARSAVPGPTVLISAVETWTGTFHNGTSRSFPGLQRFA